MLRLKNRSEVPPRPRAGFARADGSVATRAGQWALYVQETDCWLFAGNFGALSTALRAHLAANNLPVPADVDLDAERRICERVPCTEAMEPGERAITWDDLKRYVQTLGLMAGKEYVPQEEANRRAEICAGCTLQVKDIKGCVGCVRLPRLILRLFGKRATPFDDRLFACRVCACQNSVSVWFPLDVLRRASAGLEYPEDTRADGSMVGCWRR